MKNIEKILVGLNLLAQQAEVMIAQKLLVSLSCAETIKSYKGKKKKKRIKEKEIGHQLCN